MAEPVPRYYLHNYRELLAWVDSRYRDLLTQEELDFIAAFRRLDEGAAALLVRMISRKGEWFRESKLNYPEIGNAEAIAAHLHTLTRAGFVSRELHLDLINLFQLFLRPELGQWLGQKAGTKSQWQAMAEERYGAPARDWVEQGFPEPVYQDRIALQCMAICDVLNLLFFGNSRQSLSEFVLTELGVFRYEQLDIDEHSRSFQHREQLHAYQQMQNLREAFEQSDEPQACLAQLGAEPDLAWLARRYHRFRYRLGYRLEQLQQFDAALDCYRDNPVAEARTRAARCLEKAGQPEAALALAESIQLAPRNELEQQWLQRALPRLQKAQGKQAKKILRFKPATHQLTLPPGERRVEQLAAIHFSTDDAPALWCENAVWTGLVGLVLWPALFAPLPGAFFHPFQAGPKDLYEPDFVSQRQPLVDDCLAMLSAPDYRQQLRERYQQKFGLQSPFVFWQAFPEPVFELALQCIPAQHIAAVCRRLLFDIQANRAGFPDLIQFYPARQTYRMIEIKGPGDKLQDNQLRWLAFFEQQQMPAEVVHVVWGDDEPA